MIPNSSVIPQAERKQVFVFKDSKALAMEITTGVRDSAMCRYCRISCR
jgi:hypothetical protein